MQINCIKNTKLKLLLLTIGCIISYSKPCNSGKTNEYQIKIVTWNHIPYYKLLVFDKNTWNHTSLCKLFVVDINIWYYLIVQKQMIIEKGKD